jgi:hypothetical protein
MGLNEIQTWIAGIATGGITLTTIISGINLFKGIFSGRKVEKLMNFTAVADNNIKTNQMSFATLKKDLMRELKEEIVAPLVAQIKQLSSDNTSVTTIAVTLLSMVNVPIDQKRELFNVLSKVSSVSSQATEFLRASIKSQEGQIAVNTQTKTALTEKINGI